MKIKQEHLQHMKQECLSLLDKNPNIINQYETGQIPRADRVKNLQVRFNSDVMYHAGLTKWICDNLYSYMDDTHIASALRLFMPAVTRKY